MYISATETQHFGSICVHLRLHTAGLIPPSFKHLDRHEEYCEADRSHQGLVQCHLDDRRKEAVGALRQDELVKHREPQVSDWGGPQDRPYAQPDSPQGIVCE